MIFICGVPAEEDKIVRISIEIRNLINEKIFISNNVLMSISE